LLLAFLLFWHMRAMTYSLVTPSIFSALLLVIRNTWQRTVWNLLPEGRVTHSPIPARSTRAPIASSAANPHISHAVCSADFQVCRIAGFQTRRAPEAGNSLPTWKSAIQQAWKPALPARRRSRSDKPSHSLSTSSSFAKNSGRPVQPAPIHQSNNPSIPFLFGCGFAALRNMRAKVARGARRLR